MRNMKRTREQISLASLCVNPSKQPTIPLIPHNPHYFTNTNTPKKPASLPKGRWRNSSIICPTSLAGTQYTERQEKKSQTLLTKSQRQRSRSLPPLFNRIQQKGPTIDGDFFTNLFDVLRQPWRTCQVNNLTFLETIILHNEEKTDSLVEEWLIKH